MTMAEKHREIVCRVHHDGEEVAIPVGTLVGSAPGPTVAITAGMHAGEYTGVLAAIRLFQQLDPAELRGTLIIVPVISTRAFMWRNMQLSPVDEKEMHYQVPGNPDGTYSELHIDVLYSIVKDATYLIDMHAGEFAQSLAPWVAVPIAGSDSVCQESMRLARGFNVPYLDLRTEQATIPAWCRFLAEQGIANCWTEIGSNGLPDDDLITLQYEGCLNALKVVGLVRGEPRGSVRHRYLGHQQYTVTAEQSGLWYPQIRAGDRVRQGQLLGELRDYFGELIEQYHAPFDGIVAYYWTSPAINAERRPHGYAWHSGLVRLFGPPTDTPNIPAHLA
jgi:predicted deacylase